MATTNFKVATESERKCNPNYETWRDVEGNGCDFLYSKKFCSKYGGYGINMPETSSDFIDYSVDGFSAWACPHCGCYGKFLTILTIDYIFQFRFLTVSFLRFTQLLPSFFSRYRKGSENIQIEKRAFLAAKINYCNKV